MVDNPNILQWESSSSLVFYALAFFIALGWSLLLRHRANRKFSLENAPGTSLHNPYEIAYLAGGGARCTQVLIAHFHKAGVIRWREGRLFQGGKVVATDVKPRELSQLESSVHASILSYGSKGMPLLNLHTHLQTKLSGVESKLATQGLRPTTGEVFMTGFTISFPLVLLSLVGLLTLFVGLSANEFVGLHIVFLFLTLVTIILVASSKKKLTSAGRKLLDEMRSELVSGNPPRSSSDTTLHKVALLGILEIGSDEGLVGLPENARREISQLGTAGSSGNVSAGGCSSGCGSGCGGCGGD